MLTPQEPPPVSLNNPKLVRSPRVPQHVMNSPQNFARPSRALRNAIVTSLACAALASQARAANNTWKGIDGNFSNAANWSGTLTTGDTLIFPAAPIAGGTGVTSLTNNSAVTTFTATTFQTGVGNYTISTSGTANYGTLTGGSSTAAARGGSINFVSNYTGSGSQTLTLNLGGAGTGNNNIGDGNTINFVTVGGTQGTGGTNNILLASVTGMTRSRNYYNGADYAYRDAGGFVRAPVYGDGTGSGGTDSGFVLDSSGAALGGTVGVTPNYHYNVTSSIAGQGDWFSAQGGAATGVLTVKFSGAGAVDLTQNVGTTLQFGTGSGTLGGGILRSGGGSTTISGGTVQFGNGLLWYLRADSAADTLIINSSIAATTNSGTNHLTKSGAGTLVIGGSENIAGVTWINEGTFLANGNHVPIVSVPAITSSYIVNPGATLGGTGSITTANTGNMVQVNGTLAPGNSLGATPDLQTGKLTINTASMNFTAGSTLAAQLGGTTAGSFDQLALTNAAGTISLTGTVNLNLTWVGTGSVAGTYLIIDTSAFSSAPGWATLFNGTTNGGVVGISGLPGGYTSTIGYGASGVTITVISAIPEPREYALGVAGLLGTLILIRNRRRVSAA